MELRNNISNTLYLKLKEMFVNGEFEFGEKLVELKLCDELKVSRTPLREAIKKLEIEGIVERTPTGRMKITDMSIEKISEIIDIRIALENIILTKIIKENFSNVILEELNKNLKETKKQIDNSNWIEAKKCFSDFNSILYSNSKLDYTIKILSTYSIILSKLRRQSLDAPERIKEAFHEHILLVDLISKKEIREAKKINKAHLLQFKKSILKHFEEK